MKWLESLAVAFAMYSKLPMPQVEWKKENMRFALCFFPLVGAVIGLLAWLWQMAGEWLGIGVCLKSAGYVMIPVLVSGGIHLDGLLDTADALASWQMPERRLEILKDSHAGAFAVIAACSYFLASFAIWTEAEPGDVAVLGVGFVLSRALGGFGICTFPCAKESGLAATFSQGADQKKARTVLVVEAVICIVGMLALNLRRGVAGAVAALVVCAFCKGMAIRKFGGITGDIQGFFLQMCELVMAYVVILL